MDRAIMTRQTGITAETPERFIVDSGAVFLGFTDFTTTGTLLGATSGGSTFTIEQETIELPVDGAHGPVKGCRRIVGTKATLTVNILEHTLQNLARSLVGSSTAPFDVLWDQITRDTQIDDSDYNDNVTLIGELSGNSEPIGIQLKNVIIDSNFELSFIDKEEGVLAVTFTAHFDPADLETEPWVIFWPKKFEILNLLDANGDNLLDANGDNLTAREETT